MIVRQISTLEKVLRQTDADKIHEFDSFSAFRNERFSYQIIVKNESNEDKTAHIEIDSKLESIITIGRLEYVYVNRPSGLDEMNPDDFVTMTPGYVPDAIFPIENGDVTLPANENTPLLVTVNADKFIADAGTYDIDVKLKFDDDTISKRFTLEIIDALLPEQTLMYTNWFHCDAIALEHNVKVFSEKFWELTEKYMLAAADIGMNMILTPIFTPPLDTEVGGERLTVQLVDIEKNGDKYEFEFSKLYRWIALAKKCGMKYFEMAHLFTQWGAEFTPKIVVKVNGKDEKLFGWNVAADDKSYEDFLSQFLPALTEALKKADVDNVTFFHISDEPSADKALVQYAKCRSLTEKYIKGFVIMDALSNPDFYETETVTYPVPDTSSVKKFMKFDIKDRWTYYCCGQCINLSNRFTAMNGWMTRLIGAQFYKFDIHGFLHWGFNHYFSILSKELINPYEKNDYCNFPTGDSFIVYPYKDGVVPSLRGQLFYDALQDQRALILLGNMIGRENAIAIVEKEAGIELEFDKFPHNAEFILNWRMKVNEAIKASL